MNTSLGITEPMLKENYHRRSSRTEFRAACGKFYFSEAIRLETQLHEHKEACIKGETQIFAIAEHAWENSLPIAWTETKVVALTI